MIRQPPPARPEARNRRLRQWFIAVSAAVVITVAVLVMLGFVQLSAARADWSEALEESGEARMTADITATFWHEHEAGLAYLSQPSPAGLLEVTQERRQFSQQAARLAPGEKPAERRLLTRAVAAEAAYNTVFARARAAGRSGSRQQIAKATANLHVAADRVHLPLAALSRSDALGSDAGQAAAVASSNRLLIIEAVTASLVIVSSLAFAMLSVSLLGRALRREDELRAAFERLRELDRMKDEFVSLVSHELRTPLTSIIGFLELLTDPETSKLDERQREFMIVMKRNADRLLRLAGDVLLLSRLESGEMTMRLADTDLTAVARREVAGVRPDAERKHITLTLDAAEVPHIHGDEDRLAQLLGNLLTNALKFTPEGGWVSVTVGCEDGSVVMTVADSGIGLSAEDREHIFERFYRAPDTGSQAIQGTGLGLTISETIVKAHGGAITVDSEPGHGATFRVRLPAAGVADRAVGGAASSLPVGRTALARSLPAVTSPSAPSRWPAHCRHGAGPRCSRGTVRC